MAYDPNGPDPMDIRFFKDGSDWKLQISDPLKLGTATEPTWQSTLEGLVEDHGFFVKEVSGTTTTQKAVDSVRAYSGTGGTFGSGTMYVPRIQEDHGTARWAYPDGGSEVKMDWGQRANLTVTLTLTLESGVDPSTFDAFIMPIPGWDRSGRSVEDGLTAAEAVWSEIIT